MSAQIKSRGPALSYAVWGQEPWIEVCPNSNTQTLIRTFQTPSIVSSPAMAASSFVPGTVVQSETSGPLTRLTAAELSDVRKQAVATFKKLNPAVSNGKIVVKGFDDVPRSNTGRCLLAQSKDQVHCIYFADHEDLFRQESFFYHLTGQNVPGHWLVIDIATETYAPHLGYCCSVGSCRTALCVQKHAFVHGLWPRLRRVVRQPANS